MGDIIQTIVTALTEMVTGSANAIGTGLQSLLFTTNGDVQTLSSGGIVILTMVGIGFAIGLMRVIFGLIRGL